MVDRVKRTRASSQWYYLKQLLCPPQPSRTHTWHPDSSDDQLLEYTLLKLDDQAWSKVVGEITLDGKIAGTDALSSGDAILDAEIAAHYREKGLTSG